MKHIITLIHDNSDRDRVMLYVKNVYRKVYGTTPGESDVYIVARSEDTITGVIALDFANKDGKMPIEYIYEIDWEEITFPIHSYNAVQFGRWIAEDPHVSVCLSYIATVYSLKCGKEYIWLTQTDITHRILRQKGIVFYPLKNVKLIRDNIPVGDLAYYLSPDCPKCYISVAQQQKEALEKKSNEIISSGYVVFDDNLL
jgi:hypothetical protein